ncbi:MAG: type III polyketide synthase [Verrucomicrobia bacterium]|nr:type III polyketide synthase [Cytophagales bacterium]
MKSYLNAIGTAVPEYQVTQTQVLDFMSRSMQLNSEEKQKLAILYRSTGIQTRHTVLPDYLKDTENYNFFPRNETLEPFPTIAPRMDLYRKNAVNLCEKAVRECVSFIQNFDFQQVTHLITVSCTGMYAPGIDIELVEKLGLATDVQRVSVNFMGCYAAFSALRVADHICQANATAQVLVVCVELCTIHFQKQKADDHLLANALFADGAAAVLVSGKVLENRNALGINAMYSDLVLTGKQDMAWHISDFGFEMVLSAYIPTLIEAGIKSLTEKLLSKTSFQLSDIDFFAIHPGGKKILEVIEKQLKLSKEANHFAYEILRNYGNMSSPTVLFVLKNLWESLKVTDKGKKILSFAFGPGLTLESAVFEIV